MPSNGAADVLRRAVDALRRRHGVRPLPVFLFGYSAGGQLVALLQDDPPFPVAAWGVCGCGVFPDVPRAGAPALVACGVDDAGRLEIGRTFAYRYREAGGPLLWYPAKGGHEPNERALRLARAFLAAAASKTERVPRLPAACAYAEGGVPAPRHVHPRRQAVKCNGWSGCPQDTLGMVPSAIRRVAAHCLEMARTTVAHPPNRLQMARAARRSRAAGGICNSCSAEARFAGLTGNCYTTSQSRESTCLTMLRNECCVGYWKAGRSTYA